LQRGEALDAQAMMLLEMFAPPSGTAEHAKPVRVTAERPVPAPAPTRAADTRRTADRIAAPDVRSSRLAFAPEQVS
jgi:hypothetical protein